MEIIATPRGWIPLSCVRPGDPVWVIPHGKSAVERGVVKEKTTDAEEVVWVSMDDMSVDVASSQPLRLIRHNLKSNKSEEVTVTAKELCEQFNADRPDRPANWLLPDDSRFAQNDWERRPSCLWVWPTEPVIPDAVQVEPFLATGPYGGAWPPSELTRAYAAANGTRRERLAMLQAQMSGEDRILSPGVISMASRVRVRAFLVVLRSLHGIGITTEPLASGSPFLWLQEKDLSRRHCAGQVIVYSCLPRDAADGKPLSVAVSARERHGRTIQHVARVPNSLHRDTGLYVTDPPGRLILHGGLGLQSV